MAAELCLFGSNPTFVHFEEFVHRHGDYISFCIGTIGFGFFSTFPCLPGPSRYHTPLLYDVQIMTTV